MTFLDKKPDIDLEALEIPEEPAATTEPVSEPEKEAAPTEAPKDTTEPAKTEPVAESPKEQAKPKEEENKVPLSVLLEERRQRQEMQRHYDEMAAYLQSQQQQQQPEAPINPQEDPLGALEQERRHREALQQHVEQWVNYQRQQQYVGQVEQAYVASARQFASQQQDFKDAYKFAIQSRERELQAFGVPPQVIAQQIANEERQLADTALRNGKNPAQAIYELAKARGYQLKQPEPKPDNTGQKAVEMQAEKAAVATTLSTGGKAPKADFSDADGVNLKGAAFDSWFNKTFGQSGKSDGLFRQ